MPNLNLSTNGDSKIVARGREVECRDGSLEGEIVEYNAAREMGENGATIFIN